MHGFRYYFTPLTGVLFNIRSRYSYAIGRRGILSLGGWSPRIRTRFHVTGPTRVSVGRVGRFRLRGYHPVSPDFPDRLATCHLCNSLGSSQSPRQIPQPPVHNGAPLTCTRFRLVPFRSPLLRESIFLSLPEGTEMFQFSSFPPDTYVFSAGWQGMTPTRFPHSDIPGS